MGWEALEQRGDAVARIEPLAGGVANDVWRVRVDGQPAVARLGSRNDADLAWETGLLQYLDREGLAVPRPIPTTDGRLFAGGLVVMTWVEGGPPETPASDAPDAAALPGAERSGPLSALAGLVSRRLMIHRHGVWAGAEEKGLSLPEGFVVHELDCALEGPEDAFGPVRWRTLVSADRTPTGSLTAGVAEIEPGAFHRFSPHRHAQPELYYILSGEGVVVVSGTRHPVRPGSAVFIPGGAEHGASNTGQETLRLLYVFPCDSFSEVEYDFDCADL